LFLIIWGLANFIVGGQAHFVGGVVVFVIIRLLAWKLKAAPGLFFLSIDRNGLVDPAIYERESWLTILLSAVFVLEGSKLLVNWTQGIVPEPFFGSIPGDTAQVAIDMLSGVLLAIVGFLFFKVRRSGFWLAVLATITGLISIATKWSLWAQAVPKIVSAGRAAQGRVPSDGEVQFMQAFLPTMNVVMLLCVLVAVLATYLRFFVRDFGSVPASAQRRS
jgi:hypothetical protein